MATAAQAFFAGRYAELVADTFDAGEVAVEDVAFVVGALTFVDRVDDARACLETSQASDARTIVACHFFLGLAAARAGYFPESRRRLLRDAFAFRHDRDPWVRALVEQGIAAHAFFTGRFRAAATHAQRAYQHAYEAKFAWAAMIATDMRGHALVQLGQLQRGISILEHAKQQALRLGLTNNEFAVDTSIAAYVTRFDPRPEALARVDELLRRSAHDSYSRRALLTQAAVQRAMRGEGDKALAHLEEADRDALRGDTRRGRATSLLARLWVTRWRSGPLACEPLVEALRAIVEPHDVAFRAELLGFEILVARAKGDDAGRILDELRTLARTTHHFAAKAALTQFEPTMTPVAFDEDSLAPNLRAVVQRETSVLPRIVALGLWGLIPELLGLAPSRRIIVIPSEDILLLQDYGNVTVRQRPPRWCPLLLRVLASGNSAKADIVAGLWGLRAYHPEMHDPPVRTTIHRLRAFIHPYESWIEVAGDGYRTTVPVYLAANASLPDGPMWIEGEAPMLDSVPTTADDDHATRLLRRLAECEAATAPELARATKLSPSTVLRALRDLTARDLVERVGFARATRYRLADPVKSA